MIRSLFDPRQNTLDLTVKTPYEPGQEVYNTYGEGMGWAKQACEWGFIDESIEGEGELGKGLKWELADVLSRDAENHEFVKREWKRQCKQDQSAASVDSGNEQDPPDGFSGMERDSLFFFPAGSDSAKDNLLLNDDGQLSFPLFWGIACSEECAITDKRAYAKTLDAISQSLDQEGDVTQTGKSGSDAALKETLTLQRIIRQVIDLCEKRIAKTRYTDRTTSELCDLLDSVSPSL